MPASPEKSTSPSLEAASASAAAAASARPAPSAGSASAAGASGALTWLGETETRSHSASSARAAATSETAAARAALLPSAGDERPAASPGAATDIEASAAVPLLLAVGAAAAGASSAAGASAAEAAASWGALAPPMASPPMAAVLPTELVPPLALPGAPPSSPPAWPPGCDAKETESSDDGEEGRVAAKRFPPRLTVPAMTPGGGAPIGAAAAPALIVARAVAVAVVAGVAAGFAAAGCAPNWCTTRPVAMRLPAAAGSGAAPRAATVPLPKRGRALPPPVLSEREEQLEHLLLPVLLWLLARLGSSFWVAAAATFAAAATALRGGDRFAAAAFGVVAITGTAPATDVAPLRSPRRWWFCRLRRGDLE